MGGGSADGAAVIIALNEMMNTRLTEEAMCDIGETVGADIPFCLTGGTMLARGTGNILTPLPDLEDCRFVIVKPELSVSTAEAYKAVDRYAEDHPYRSLVNSEQVCEEICSHDIPAAARLVGNAFEQVLDIPEIAEIKKQLLAAGALGASMTGSGSAVFGIFDDEDAADSCESALSSKYEHCFVALPASRGCEIED